MTRSTSITPPQSEDRNLQAPVAPETALPYCPAGFVPAGLHTDDMKSSGWRTLIVVRWLQLKLSQVICRLHLLTITHGRSPRWRRLCRQVIQAGVALLMLAAIMPQPAFASAPQPSVSLPQPSQNQPGLEDASNVPGIANPFSGVDIGYNSTPSFADIDGDGDLDAFIGEKYGTIKYFQNTGNATNPAFSERSGSLNPLNSVDVGDYSTPSFADLDADGDLDFFSGEVNGTVLYFQNIGDATSPAFTQITGTLNPLNGVYAGAESAPCLADLDADGDLDAFIGGFFGVIKFFQNTGSTTSPAFSERSGTLNPFNGVDVGYFSSPIFADLDEDGDLDTFSGESTGTILYFQNIGDATSPAFSERSGSLNPFNGVDVGAYSVPSFADLDADGDLDLFAGISAGTIQYIENTSNPSSPAFVQRTGSLNPFNGVDIGSVSTPSFADLDRDGDLDAFIGEKYGSIRHFQNTGSATAPAFTEHNGSLNPFDGVDVSMYSLPSFADLDGDGDLDAFIGQWDGIIRYYQNTGNAVSPAFDSIFGSLNPLDIVSLDYWSAPSFADLDGDGDLDAFIGDYFGTIQYFQNTGSATSPAFVQLSGSFNPFQGMDAGRFCNPSFIDLEGDGDLDLFTGNLDGMILFVENTGSATSPAFVSRSGSLNPFNGVDVGIYSTPSFADLDTNGDMDALIGESYGTINYFQNILLSGQLNLPLVLR